MSPDQVHAVAERVDSRLATTVWDLAPAEQGPSEVSAAAEVALFALKLAGKRRQARRGGKFSRLVVRFALAACVALATVTSACDAPNASPEATAAAISALPTASPDTVQISAQPRASPARFTDLILLDPGSDTQPWAVMAQKGGDAPVLVDRVGAGLQTVGDVYRIAAQPVMVGTRDGPSQFLDPLEAAVSTSSGDSGTASAARDQLEQRWGQDERYLAVTRAIAGQPTVLDAAYNAAAASAAGGTHTYLNGVVLRVEPDNPVLQVIDRKLLESALPTRAEDIVYVAIRASESALYDPGQVVNLRDVVVDKQSTDVNGQPTTVYVANAALDGARVEPTDRVDLQALFQPRLQVVNDDLAQQSQVAGAAASPSAVAASQLTPTPGRTTTPTQQTIIVQQSNNNSGAYIGDFLMFMWLTNGGFYRGGRGTTIINNYPVYGSYGSGGSGSGNVYYSPPPAPSGSSPSTIASSQAAARSTALDAARTSVSGQSSGTGGGVAATNKSAADATSRVSAATSKSAAAAGAVSASSAGKSISSAPAPASSTASRSAGSVSAGSRGSAGSSSSSSGGSKGIGGGSSSSGSSGGFGSGGKGISGGSSSSSS